MAGSEPAGRVGGEDAYACEVAASISSNWMADREALEGRTVSGKPATPAGAGGIATPLAAPSSPTPSLAATLARALPIRRRSLCRARFNARAGLGCAVLCCPASPRSEPSLPAVSPS